MKPIILLTAAGASVIAVGALVAALTHRQTTTSTLPAPSPYRGSIPPPGIRAPDFTLRDYRGKSVTIRNLRGKVVLLSFVDSKCKESCPIVASVMAAAMHRLTHAEQTTVVPLLMSVDPRVDTPRSIRRFLDRRHALALGYLVGSVTRMRPIWKAYGILPSIDTGSVNVHSSDVRIFNPKGIWVATQHAGVDLTAINLVHDTRLVLQP